MPKKEVPVSQIAAFLPPGTTDGVLQYLHQYKVHLTVAKERKSILGDYRHKTNQVNHRISVNGNLNPYAFLITLLHEIAHLLTFEQYGRKVAAHGKEWKTIFGQLLLQFLQQKVFPVEIEQALSQSISNPAASSCAEDGLLRVLRKYDAPDNTLCLVEELAENAFFKLTDQRIFQRKEKLRKRYKCVEVKTGKLYLFSPVYEVERIN
ncbi:MAG: hypothetical protein RIR12_2090 [Bacteroidota bacterium]|jgi:hypothetical protein